VILRPYVIGDALATLVLFTRSVREIARRDYSLEQVMAWAPGSLEVIEWNERRLGTGTIVSEIDGAIAGFSDVSPDGYIDMMFVDPAYTRRGVASALLGHLLDEVTVALWTNASITARGFFEGHGFEVVEEQQVELRGQVLTNYRMRLERS
jgi:putative acetyltransferase